MDKPAQLILYHPFTPTRALTLLGLLPFQPVLATIPVVKTALIPEITGIHLVLDSKPWILLDYDHDPDVVQIVILIMTLT